MRIKIGQLAEQTGLTVRTLHHYDELGLLKPQLRSGTGKHRLYGVHELERLQRILSLKAMGFGLEQIKLMLDQPQAAPLKDILEEHIERLDALIAQQQRLREKLLYAKQRLAQHHELDAQTLIQTIEETVMFEKHYTQAQLDQLKERYDALGPEAIAQVQQDWAQLFDALKDHKARGTQPDDPALAPLMQRWDALISAFTGGDPGIAQSLNNLYAQEGPSQASGGMADPALFEYVQQIRQAQG